MQDEGESSSIHHIDREWAFQDLPISGYAYDHTLQIEFELASDEGLHLGGWQLDDLCVAANVGSVCGDNVLSATEECDEGGASSDAPNARCRTTCRAAACGDGIKDRGEECDDGGVTEACSAECRRLEGAADGGCCSADRSPAGPLALSGLVGLALLRRRRRVRLSGSRPPGAAVAVVPFNVHAGRGS